MLLSGTYPLVSALLGQTGEDKTKWKIAADGGGDFFMPPQASSVAAMLDSDYHMIQGWSIFFTVLIFAVMFYFIWRYHRGRHPKAERTATHNTALELLWSVPPSFVLVYMFWRGFVGYIDLRTPPKDAEQIQVQASKWTWTFVYPNGAVAPELHVPVGRATTLTMTSSDVLHSLFVPAFRTKQDVVPGRYTHEWFIPTKTGEFLILCTEYCGTQHSDMLAKLFVHTEDEYQKKLNELANWLKDDVKNGVPAHVSGARVFRERGCVTCHSVEEGKIIIGPSLKNVFGHEVKLTDGTTVVADEAYLRESLEFPQKKIVDGFAGKSMTSFRGQINEEYLAVLFAYLKSLSDKGDAGHEGGAGASKPEQK